MLVCARPAADPKLDVGPPFILAETPDASAMGVVLDLLALSYGRDLVKDFSFFCSCERPKRAVCTARTVPAQSPSDLLAATTLRRVPPPPGGGGGKLVRFTHGRLYLPKYHC